MSSLVLVVLHDLRLLLPQRHSGRPTDSVSVEIVFQSFRIHLRDSLSHLLLLLQYLGLLRNLLGLALRNLESILKSLAEP